jgi:SAM-dependent methyltransferase
MDPASEVMLNELTSLAGGKNTSFLDMGCNQGRHLNYLYEMGYKNLTGIDFSSLAMENMQKQFPQVYSACKIINTSFQKYFAHDQEEVDIVYSRGATLEIVHPSFPIIRKICQIARQYVVIVINEAGHSYPRFWEYEFAK